MANLKSLAKDTAIYGLSSIAARFIGYLLVPIETAKFNAAGGQYGIITNIYAYIALLIIILTYGMETTFFRFMNRPGEDPKKVYPTTLHTVGFTSLLFVVLLALFIHPVASAIGYPDHPEYLMIMGVCVAIDAFTAIPFAYLRYAHRPIKFALLKMVSIAVNIVGVSLYLIVLPAMHVNLFGIYDANFDLEVVWVFWIELSGSVLTLLLLGKELKAMGNPFDKATCQRMLRYTWPLLVMGLAGQLNQCASQIIFPYVFDGNAHDARVQLGIYGACIKIATIMVMITQAFRYAYEPFVFGQSKEKNNKETYARVMKFYIIFTLLAFLCVVAYMDIIRYIIGRSYWEGLEIVPIVMAAEIMFGVFFNLSFWYKLIDKTIWGAWFSGIGAVVLIAFDIIFIPRFSYWACAWAGFASYAVSMVLSYFFGQKYYPIAYPLKSIFTYTLLAVVLFVGMSASNRYLPMLPALLVNTLLLIADVAFIVKKDLPLSSLPVIGKKFRK
ncbi:oligosaccharide flippase family protein [Hallella mizrahii]|jgi:O-antigen/teichoic acid export membrane protein|uniref:Lipopolysaccharide biosynthesis protein n=1 Tax=Hallella mizrahii TaxID=2606637 RepID=A0A7K0KEG9_9BACT|nr:lipopolysaccharide biosynthesis protein [Hallella mizrahii]MST84333.1 lipopolysaccharide biosynthesis protein [Hallella mizrahii]